MSDPMLPPPGLSSASGKSVVVKFDGGLLSSDGGVLALREIETPLRVADRLAACLRRDPMFKMTQTHPINPQTLSKSRLWSKAGDATAQPVDAKVDPRAQIDNETPKSPAPMHNAG